MSTRHWEPVLKSDSEQIETDHHLLIGTVFKPLGAAYPRLLVGVEESETGLALVVRMKFGQSKRDPWVPIPQDAIPDELEMPSLDMMVIAANRLRESVGVVS